MQRQIASAFKINLRLMRHILWHLIGNNCSCSYLSFHLPPFPSPLSGYALLQTMAMALTLNLCAIFRFSTGRMINAKGGEQQQQKQQMFSQLQSVTLALSISLSLLLLLSHSLGPFLVES